MADHQPASVRNRLSWTVGVFGASFTLKFASNIVLAHLLSPEIFGIMLIMNSARYGIELLTDVGIEQNVVRSKNASSREFISTAWIVQVVRGVILSLVFFGLSSWLAQYFLVPPEVFLVVAVCPLLNSLHSMSLFRLIRDLDVKRRNQFELTADAVSFVVMVGFVLVSPTVWSALFATVLSVLLRSALSYSIPGGVLPRWFVRAYAIEILSFGKWIAVSSLMLYLSTNIDRVLLARLVSLPTLGVYGLARTVSDIPSNLALRVSYQLVFPHLSSLESSSSRPSRSDLAGGRRKFLLLGAVVMAIGASVSDILVGALFDERYSDAKWMLFFLLIGTFFSVVSTLNESLLLSLDRANLVSLASVIRVGMLVAGILFGFALAGPLGAVMAIVVAELVRYFVIAFSLQSVGYGFWGQDLLGMLVGLVVAAVVVGGRILVGLGVPWANAMM